MHTYLYVFARAFFSFSANQKVIDVNRKPKSVQQMVSTISSIMLQYVTFPSDFLTRRTSLLASSASPLKCRSTAAYELSFKNRKRARAFRALKESVAIRPAVSYGSHVSTCVYVSSFFTRSCSWVRPIEFFISRCPKSSSSPNALRRANASGARRVKARERIAR